MFAGRRQAGGNTNHGMVNGKVTHAGISSLTRIVGSVQIPVVFIPDTGGAESTCVFGYVDAA
jgi:hypothetical protein